MKPTYIRKLSRRLKQVVSLWIKPKSILMGHSGHKRPILALSTSKWANVGMKGPIRHDPFGNGLRFYSRITKWHQIHAFGTNLVEVAIVIIWAWSRVKSWRFPQRYTSITSPHSRVRATWIGTCWGDNNRISRPRFEWNVGSDILIIIG